MRRVAIEARRGHVRRLLVTALARDGLLPGSEPVRWMAAGTRSRCTAERSRLGMRDLLGMTARARLRLGRVVLCVAADAAPVLARREHWLVGMTARARLRFGLREGMRHVTARALRVPCRDRRERDLRLRPLRRVAADARGVGDERRLMHRVTVEAATSAGVLGLLVLVTRRTRLDVEGRRAMGAMTITAGLIGVRTDGRRVLALRAVVAAHAARRPDGQIATEAVAILTCRRWHDADRIGDVQRCLDRCVALRADLSRRRRKPGIAVAVAARDLVLADVDRMAGAGADLLPRHRDRRRRRPIAAGARDQHHRDQRELHRAPIG